MIKQAFAVLDTKSGVFTPPMLVHTKGEAIRSFSDEVNNPNSFMGKYHTDFCLFHIGQYDDNNAQFTSLKAPVSVGLATEFIARPQSDQTELPLNPDLPQSKPSLVQRLMS